MSGYGRGGRGAALLSALREAQRKPGEPAAVEPVEKSEKPVGQPMGVGRGALMNLSAAPPSPGATPAAPASSPPPSIGRGRGLTGLMNDPKMTQLLGRGRGAPAVQQPPVATQTIQPAQPVEAKLGPSGDGGQRKSYIDKMMDLSLTDITTEKGTSGERQRICANYIRLHTANTDGVYLYKVAFSPDLDNLAIRRRLLREVPDLPKPFEFDGANMFSPTKMDKKTVSASTREGQVYQITIELTRVMPYRAMTQFFNIMFHRIMMELKMVPIRRTYFDEHNPQYVPQYKLEIWPGFVTSIKEYDGGLMCLVDTTHKVLRMDTVYEVIHDLSQSCRGDVKEAVAKNLVGCIVLTRYNNKTYRVDDIDWSNTAESTFETRSGPVSYSSYYKEHHNVVIKDPKQPLLIHRPSERERSRTRGTPLEIVCLVPELCYMTGLTDECRNNFRIMKALAEHTRISPDMRQARLRQFCENVNSHAATRKILSDWGLTLENNAIDLDGRKLPEEQIYLGHNKTVGAGPQAEWNTAFNRFSVREAVDLKSWMVVCTKSTQQDVVAFINQLKAIYPKLGLNIAQPHVITLVNDRTESYLSEIKKNMSPQVQLVLTVFPTSRDDRYNAVKKLCYCEMPVASQVINHRTIRDQRKVRSVAQKVALQMNAKLGGGLWAVKIPVDGLMIVGIDVFHEKGTQSWGGFVATLNQGCTQWFSTAFKQIPGQELTVGLKVALVTALREYYKLNHAAPRRIIVFRDGVGDGDFPTVRDFELPQIQSAFPVYGEDYQPQVAFIVVQKRINTKLYAMQGNPRNPKFANPAPGSIVDHTVTRKELVDFFLVSQHVNQGTVSPTHYVVVHNTTDFNVDKLQRLSYKMTHMYYNWCGTIRSPAPCQYAHKLAYMAGQNLKRDPDQRLSRRLFYL